MRAQNFSISGESEQKDTHGNPYPTLSYANGPAYRRPTLNQTSGQCEMRKASLEEGFGECTHILFIKMVRCT